MTDTYVKLKNEVLSGGGTSPQPEGPVPLQTTVVGIGTIVVALAVLGVANPWALVFVLGLIVCIFLHEVGHFVTARRSGMKVTQFFIGFGPRLWSFHRGEVEYGVRAIPLGAFVRIVGMSSMDEVPEADEPRTYRQATYPRRMLVITAGSLMHFLIALVLSSAVYATGGRLEENGSIVVRAVVPGSGAADAGLREGDTIVTFDGQQFTRADEFRAEILKHEPGEVVAIGVVRDGQPLTLQATLGSNPAVPANTYLGLASDSLDFQDKSVPAAVGDSVADLSDGLVQSVKGVVRVINPVNLIGHLTGSTDDLDTRPTTLVGISQVSGDIGSRDGLKAVLLLLASVNVFVGVFNLLPLLPFDGGHAAIATYERVRSRRGRRYMADVSKAVPVTMVVLMLVALLFFTGLYLDIAKPL